MSTSGNHSLNAFLAGSLRIDATSHTIDPGGADVRIEPRIMDVLVRLACTPGRTVSREELLIAGWTDAPYVSDESLTKAISDLRKCLSTVDPDTQYIRTVPKKGYLLAVPVQSVDASSAAWRSDSGDGRSVAVGDAGRALPEIVRVAGTEPDELRRLKRTVRRIKISIASLVIVIAGGGSLATLLPPREPLVRIRSIALPASDLDPDSPLARILADTTFATESSAREWLDSRDASVESLKEGQVVKRQDATPDY